MKMKSKIFFGLTLIVCQGALNEVNSQAKVKPAPTAEKAVILPKTSNPNAIQAKATTTAQVASSEDMPREVIADRFADVQVLRYGIPGFSDLTLKQKQLSYYLYEAGLCGRDIYWD